MQTQCPSCRSVFRVSHQQLSAAGGLVRCGKCSVIFNGNENIKRLRSHGASNAPSAPSRAASTSVSATNQPTPAIARKHKTQATTAFELRQAAPAETVDPEIPKPKRSKAEQLWPQGRASKEPIPAEPLHPPVGYYLNPLDPPRSRPRKALYGSIVLLMLVLLTAGYLYYERDRLTGYPIVAAWLTTACEYLGCVVEPRRDVTRIEIIDRNVFTHPDRPDALVITLTLVNKAPFPQPYPLVQVSFTNLQGTVVATRRFKPDEYLLSTPDAAALMATGAPVRVSVEIPDPGVDATAFEFAFL
jgi:predicted Zn finger-like uncharacterized protein